MQVQELGHLEFLFAMSIGTARSKGALRLVNVVEAKLGLDSGFADGIAFVSWGGKESLVASELGLAWRNEGAISEGR
jgi:hypothetical protein